MNRSGSHPDHENRQIIFSTVLIRRGGAPSGAAEVIIFRGMGVSTPISNSRRPIFMGNHLILIMTLSGALPPPLWHPPVAIVLHYLFAIVEKVPVQVIPGHHNAPPPPIGGAGLAQGGRSSLEKRISPRAQYSSPGTGRKIRNILLLMVGEG